MSWSDIVNRASLLKKAASDKELLAQRWSDFVDCCKATEDAVPNHLRGLIRQLEEYRGDRARNAITIVDHGCGDGLSLLYLVALGYQDVYGVDLYEASMKEWNILFDEVLNISPQRWLMYDGNTMPIADDSVDFIFSQEVLEHVEDQFLAPFYAEEFRVLKAGGIVLHSVPHRLVPYDCHTQSWCLHWFVSGETWDWFAGRLGVPKPRGRRGLFLRWPWFYSRHLRSVFGNCADLTVRRLLDLQSFSVYDGPKTVRGLMAALFNLPLVGRPAALLFAKFFLSDLRAIKRG